MPQTNWSGENILNEDQQGGALSPIIYIVLHNAYDVNNLIGILRDSKPRWTYNNEYNEERYQFIVSDSFMNSKMLQICEDYDFVITKFSFNGTTSYNTSVI